MGKQATAFSPFECLFSLGRLGWGQNEVFRESQTAPNTPGQQQYFLFSFFLFLFLFLFIYLFVLFLFFSPLLAPRLIFSHLRNP